MRCIRNDTIWMVYCLADWLADSSPLALIPFVGFLYMSDFLHSFLTASQYIAPLMANFDTSINHTESELLYKESGKSFYAPQVLLQFAPSVLR